MERPVTDAADARGKVTPQGRRWWKEVVATTARTTELWRRSKDLTPTRWVELPCGKDPACPGGSKPIDEVIIGPSGRAECTMPACMEWNGMEWNGMDLDGWNGWHLGVD